MAPKRKIAHYCWPRLVLVCGLAICSLIALIIMGIYFAGSSERLEDMFMAVCGFFFGEFDEDDKIGMKKDIRNYAYAFAALVSVFFIYTLFELLLLKKMYNDLKDQEFHPVATQEPSAPPAFNPEYGKA